MKLNKHLLVFNHIISHGEHKDGKYWLENLSAWHDLDGYTCFLGYKDLVMTIYFHNRFNFDYQDKQTLEKFHRIIERYELDAHE
ncbi:DUF3081 family protein [Thalassotalea sp. PP2-459]|uniref:DUF3081 family protein n=1 Tax=Thalassotalea sp. PP2-459 TaxID=1742724 RepID=UPI0009428D50|nr:DUF3081 family protein [Thalassotalea sp. PP2-459]OKY27858.1 hypothetical protein BI291_07340 [Thalassotalea sp. PP2-459]